MHRQEAAVAACRDGLGHPTPSSVLPELPALRQMSICQRSKRLDRGPHARQGRTTNGAPRCGASHRGGGRRTGPSPAARLRGNRPGCTVRSGCRSGGYSGSHSGAHPAQRHCGGACRVLHPAAHAGHLSPSHAQFYVPCRRRLGAAVRQRQPREAVGDRPDHGCGQAVPGRRGRTRRGVPQRRPHARLACAASRSTPILRVPASPAIGASIPSPPKRWRADPGRARARRGLSGLSRQCRRGVAAGRQDPVEGRSRLAPRGPAHRPSGAGPLCRSADVQSERGTGQRRLRQALYRCRRRRQRPRTTPIATTRPRTRPAPSARSCASSRSSKPVAGLPGPRRQSVSAVPAGCPRSGRWACAIRRISRFDSATGRC